MRIYILSCLCLLIFASTAKAETYEINGDVTGKIQHYVVKKKDNLYWIARHFDIGIVELLSANPKVNVWKPKEGTKLIIPTMYVLPETTHENIVVNLSELRLFYFTDDGKVMTFPIAIGREDWETQQGTTIITSKREHPTWTPPDSIREENPELPDIVPAGKDNPLGDYAMHLGWPNYVIHGTNKPYSVGKRSSHGCIRLYPEDIEKLFAAVKTGTKVTVIDTPYKLGWQGDNLFLEVMPNQRQSDIVARSQIPPPLAIPEIHAAVIKQSAENVIIDWHAVDELIQKRSGVPAVIASKNNF